MRGIAPATGSQDRTRQSWLKRIPMRNTAVDSASVRAVNLPENTSAMVILLGLDVIGLGVVGLGAVGLAVVGLAAVGSVRPAFCNAVM
jgi:hypothetical protein